MFCLNSHRISMGSSVSSHWERRERERAAKWLEIFCQTQMVSWLLFQPTCVCLWSCGCCGRVWRISNTLRSFTQRRISMRVLIFTTLVSLEKQIWLFRVYLCKSVSVRECAYKKREVEEKNRKTPKLHSSLLFKSTDKRVCLHSVGSLWKIPKNVEKTTLALPHGISACSAICPSPPQDMGTVWETIALWQFNKLVPISWLVTNRASCLQLPHSWDKMH